MDDNTPTYFVGVDVGTGSARAALVSLEGALVRTHTSQIRTWNPLPDHYEQSSEDIWRAVCECVKSVVAETDAARHVLGIGFDATCSLVALDAAGSPSSLSTTGRAEQNIILWMDHRAAAQAAQINHTGHPILRHVGGAVSLEMQTPKMLWCKQHLAGQQFDGVAEWFDLPDFLTWRCTGDRSRSLCSLVCKWNYDGTKGEWPADFFTLIGLERLLEDGSKRIGVRVVAPGTPVPGGLTAEAAAELGLVAGTAVGASMIDAHSGALAMLGSRAEGVSESMAGKMAIICGTSSCHMSVVPQPLFVPGVWGPYGGALFADMHLHEAGQSATGLLLDHIVRSHPAYAELTRLAAARHPHVFLNEWLIDMAGRKAVSLAELTRDVHVVPDYHGNRSPLADARARGAICGLTMSTDLDDLARMYLAFVQALAYGTRHIIDRLTANGRQPFETLHIGGGLSNNALFVQTHADVCGLPVLLAAQSDVMLLGASILGARAAGVFDTLQQATKAMAGGGPTVRLPDGKMRHYHDRKYAVFLRMLEDQKAYRLMMLGS